MRPVASEIAPADPCDLSAIETPELVEKQIDHYHAHIYYDSVRARVRAAQLRERVARHFPAAKIGRWHDELVGPHTRAMYQIAFPPELLSSFLPWLMLNRDGLVILLHPGTDNSYRDHTDHAAWLGGILPLRLDVLPGERPKPAP